MSKKKTGILLSDADLKRRYPTSGLASDICIEPENRIWLPSRNLALNWQLGGGNPYGRILEIHGQESTGKSLLAADFGVVAQSLGGIVLWNDAEAVFEGTWYEKHGLDLSRVDLLPDENAIEVISDWQADKIIYWRNKLKKNEPILLVGDSIAAYDTLANLEASDVDSGEDRGRRAKWIYQMVRKRNSLYAKYGVNVIYINQLRKKSNATQWEDPDTTPGGEAMKFYASQRLGLYKSKSLFATKNLEYKKDVETVGSLVRFQIKKNKVAPPRIPFKAQVFFTEHQGNFGYDKYYGLAEVLRAEGIIRKKGNGYFYKKDRIAKSKDDLEEVIRSDAKLRGKLIIKAGINSASQTREKIASIGYNQYPVKKKLKSDE